MDIELQGLSEGDAYALFRHCQTNLGGPVRCGTLVVQAANSRHSCRAVARSALKFLALVRCRSLLKWL